MNIYALLHFGYETDDTVIVNLLYRATSRPQASSSVKFDNDFDVIFICKV